MYRALNLSTMFSSTPENGSVYTFGDGSSGQLGHGTQCLQISVPRKLNLKHKVRYIACGENHTSLISGESWTFCCFTKTLKKKLNQGFP